MLLATYFPFGHPGFTMQNQTSAIIPSIIHVSDLDPNVQKNRIPTEAELIGLQSLKQTHSRLAEHLQQEVKRAQNTHDILLSKYHRQLQELEGTQSQLHESKKTLAVLSEQYSVHRKESERLSGLVHPIRRLSSELLQSIFEFTSQLVAEEEEIDVAITLSHVCQRWRFIAVDTPRLWCCLDYTLEEEDSDVSFWDCMVSRMKSVPASIIIRDFGATTSALMSNYKLTRGSIVENITFHLTSVEDFGQLLSLPSELYGEQIRALNVEPPDNTEEAAETPMVEWSLTDLLEKFSYIKKLNLRGTSNCSLRVNTSKQYTTITTLLLQNLKEVDALGILSILTQLSEFQLEETTIPQRGPVSQVVSNSLQCLAINVEEGNYSWISHLLCPNLVAFHQVGTAFPEVCLAFVESHTSIRTLDFEGEQNIIPRLARSAPQLRTLFLDTSQIPSLYITDPSVASTLPFQFLERIGIYIYDDSMTIPVFESLVRTRCLPVTHPGHQVMTDVTHSHAIANIHISQPEACNPKTPWRTSDLFRIATQTVGVQAIWVNYPTITLSWK